MRKALLLTAMILAFAIPVAAVEITAPPVPDSGVDLMPENTERFSDALWELFTDALARLEPEIADACKICTGIIGTVLLISVLEQIPSGKIPAATLSGTVLIATMLLGNTRTLIQLGMDVIRELSEYGKLLIPVMTSALAAQGSITGSGALYAGTAAFGTILSNAIHNLLVPGVYLYLAMAVASSAIGEEILKKLAKFLKWLITWCLKIILYIFTGYISITGVVSGTTDAAALKAAKLTISGAVPVVGGILSDASEAILVSAGLVKNAAGIYGILAVMAVYMGPFIKIGAHYLLLKATAAICAVFGNKTITDLIGDFSGAMGLLLAMTGSVCLLLLISTVCFMKGAG